MRPILKPIYATDEPVGYATQEPTKDAVERLLVDERDREGGSATAADAAYGDLVNAIEVFAPAALF